jgi:hypothetical protein
MHPVQLGDGEYRAAQCAKAAETATSAIVHAYSVALSVTAFYSRFLPEQWGQWRRG